MLNSIEIIENMSMRKLRRKDTQKKEIYKVLLEVQQNFGNEDFSRFYYSRSMVCYEF